MDLGKKSGRLQCGLLKASRLRAQGLMVLAPSWGFLVIVFLMAGCISGDRYTYSRIRAEYGKTSAAPQDTTKQGPPCALPEPGVPLTLEKTIEIALKNNPDMDMAVARIRQSEAVIDQAKAAFWPSLSIYAEHLRGEAPSSYLFKTIDQRNLPAGLNFNDPGPFENNELGLTARFNLFHGGRDYLRMRMAETGLALYELDRITVQNGLVASVIHAYYDTLAARDFIRIAEESVDTVSAELRIMKVRFDAGGALKSDVLSLEVRLARAREDLIRAQNSHSLSLASLCNLLGLDPDEEMNLAERCELPFTLPDNYDAGLSLALAHRPELEKARLTVIQSRMGVDAARGEYLPRLDAQARYYADDEGLRFESEKANWTAGVILNWDVFTGLSTGASVRRAEGVIEEMLAADRKAILSVKLDLKTAYLRLAEAEARLEVARASVARAEESLRLVKAQYEGGSAAITRYLDAEAARNTAAIRSTAAFYDREKARAAVGRAVGYWGRYKDFSKSVH